MTGGLDWEPGPWLSSWETSLPPDQPRYFNHDGFDGCTWLLTGEKAPEDIVEDDDFWADSDYDNAADGDARPCEIVPRQGAADPSWRYVLINTYGEPPSIVMGTSRSKNHGASSGLADEL